MNNTDHTFEVEQRVSAIRIDHEDGCAFFSPREGYDKKINKCWYCKFGLFEGTDSIPQKGLCKYRLQIKEIK